MTYLLLLLSVLSLCPLSLLYAASIPVWFVVNVVVTVVADFVVYCYLLRFFGVVAVIIVVIYAVAIVGLRVIIVVICCYC